MLRYYYAMPDVDAIAGDAVDVVVGISAARTSCC